MATTKDADNDDEIEAEELEEEETPKPKKGKPKAKAPPKPAAKSAKAPHPRAAAPSEPPAAPPPRRPAPVKAGPVAKIKARTFHGWVQSLCKRELQPHHFTLELPDGEEKIIPLTKSRSGSILIAECISTIETFEPARVEAFSRDDVSDEEMSLGQWVFPPKSEPDETTAPSAIILPGYLPEEGDSKDDRSLKVAIHLIADAYRYNAEANKGMIDAMSRVMEMQANAFARERESISKTVQAREKLARLNAGRFRVAPGTVADVVRARIEAEDDEPEEREEEVEDTTFKDMLKIFTVEYAKRAAAGGGAAPATPVTPAP